MYINKSLFLFSIFFLFSFIINKLEKRCAYKGAIAAEQPKTTELQCKDLNSRHNQESKKTKDEKIVMLLIK